MTFPLHTIVGYHRELCDATIQGQPVIDAVLERMGIDYTAGVSTADHHFHRFCRNHAEGRRFILAQLDGAVLELNELQQRAVDLVARFGPFVLKKERDAITLHTSVEYWHDDYNAKKLQSAVDKINNRANGMLAMARAGVAGNDKRLAIGFTDDQVAAGVRYRAYLKRGWQVVERPPHQCWGHLSSVRVQHPA